MSHLAVQAATKYKEKIFQILSVIQIFCETEAVTINSKIKSLKAHKNWGSSCSPSTYIISS